MKRTKKSKLEIEKIKNKYMRAWLKAILEYPKKGNSKRAKDGYPSEVVYDEFAYRRIVDTYRTAARMGLGIKK